MNKHRLEFTATGIGVLALTAVAFGVGVWSTANLRTELDAQLVAVAEAQQQQSELAYIKRLAAETETDRRAVGQYFLTNEAESIEFLSFVENLAQSEGLALEPNSATLTEDASALAVSYTLNAPKPTLLRIIGLLESAPYALTINQLNLTGEGDEWEATLDLTVATSQYEIVQ
jgi:hypothetical protein